MTAPNPSHDTPENAAEKTTETGTGGDANLGTCPWCQTPVPPHTGRGRPRVWCSDQCRRDAHNARKAARAGAVGMQVIRQTRTVEKTVKVPVYEHRNPYVSTPAAVDIDDHDITLHVLTDPALLARILDSFAAGLDPRLADRNLTGPLHESALRLAPLLDDYCRTATAPPPEPAGPDTETAGLSRQQRRAQQRSRAKNTRP